jgi:hypothetical protein
MGAAVVTDQNTPSFGPSFHKSPPLIAEFAGEHLHELRTPALVIDRHVFSRNGAKMRDMGMGVAFKAHLKTYKVITVRSF